MVRRKRPLTDLDHLIDDLLGENPTPEQILGEGGLVKTLTQRLIERALAGELTTHLKAGDRLTEAAAPPSPRNSRNGYSKKTVQTDQGNLSLEIPRDRQGEFEPILVPKHQRRLAGLDEKIIAPLNIDLQTLTQNSVRSHVFDSPRLCHLRLRFHLESPEVRLEIRGQKVDEIRRSSSWSLL
jgi:Transposase, Mutator family